MNTKKLLYVDDEVLALKYFERLVGSIVPVLTADSVAAGIKMLELHGDDIAILVTDQRMPGAYGNELLQYAREHHPKIVRMLTTAYSEIDDAISAINSGEIYRYITKPWNVDSLRADLKNALELADLKAERDSLLHAKLSVQQGQWLATRVGQLSAVLASIAPPEAAAHALHQYLLRVQATGGARLNIAWHQTDLADWVQADAQRHAGIARLVGQWCATWSTIAVTPSAAQAQSVLDGLSARSNLTHPALLLEAPAKDVVDADSCVWLAWLVWAGPALRLVFAEHTGEATVHTSTAADVLRTDWLAGDIEQLITDQST